MDNTETSSSHALQESGWGLEPTFYMPTAVLDLPRGVDYCLTDLEPYELNRALFHLVPAVDEGITGVEFVRAAQSELTSALAELQRVVETLDFSQRGDAAEIAEYEDQVMAEMGLTRRRAGEWGIG